MAKRVALVTGGAQGIGRAISEAFLRAGMRVAMVDCDGEALEQAKQRCMHLGEVLSLKEDVARAALFLADPANDFITGENLVIDGGMTRKMLYV
ncbi:SDR family oxidoreductase [Geoalkalibacter subterraneus]|uniref:Short-chain dehydrogenase n=1 Tax=Geoalkalibacter subterraneus TaxID=483547 RepID=A0A0B5FS30_9BACT|nr:SDR family oxidoreductase [Geoalkalibacter subterraneus]AJF07459.1 hypothetical protein GSUB_14100 [Geoalkalibacter subterraneus]